MNEGEAESRNTLGIGAKIAEGLESGGLLNEDVEHE